jgi:hypothetical protein
MARKVGTPLAQDTSLQGSVGVGMEDIHQKA